MRVVKERNKKKGDKHMSQASAAKKQESPIGVEVPFGKRRPPE